MAEMKVEMEKVTIEVPKAMMRFLRAMELHLQMTPKEYLEYNAVGTFGADFDTLDVFMPDPKVQVKQYCLTELNKVVKGVIPSYFIKDC